MRVRPAELDDAAAIMAIYNPVVETSTATFDLVPRTLDQQRAWLADRSGARIVLVAVDEQPGPTATDATAADATAAGATATNATAIDAPRTVLGFAALSPYRDRAAYSTTVEDSVYVHPDHQGRGVGRALLDELVDRARAHGFHAVMARIVSDHRASIALHEACGFERVGVEREVGRKFGRWLDVVLMERLLG